MQTVSEHEYFTLQHFLSFMLLRIKEPVNEKKTGSQSPTKYALFTVNY